mmetsp:Transcript_82795/g.229889  ORF Transcript_82795/g.229889 Transcript_82795/m.229889 type:complete len:208 (+) Transcript_82795:188-811(+)
MLGGSGAGATACGATRFMKDQVEALVCALPLAAFSRACESCATWDRTASLLACQPACQPARHCARAKSTAPATAASAVSPKVTKTAATTAAALATPLPEDMPDVPAYSPWKLALLVLSVSAVPSARPDGKSEAKMRTTTSSHCSSSSSPSELLPLGLGLRAGADAGVACVRGPRALQVHGVRYFFASSGSMPGVQDFLQPAHQAFFS